MIINLTTIIKYLLIFFGFFLLLDLKRLLGDFIFVETAQSLLKGGLYLFSICIFIIFYFRKKEKGFNKTTYFLFGYVFVCALSIIWSKYLVSTIIGLVSAFGAIALGLMSARYIGFKKSIKYFIFGVELILILSLLNLLVGRDSYVYLQGVDRYVGITFGPHALARGAAVVFIYWFCRLLSSWTKFNTTTKFYGVFLLLLTFISIVLADSRQVLGALLIAFIFALWRYTHRYVIVILAAIPIFIAVFTLTLIIFDFQTINLNSFVRSDISELTTFTGRTEIWNSAIRLIKNAPLMGYGFNAGGLVLEEAYNTNFGWSTRSAHNSVLHATLDVGIIGAFFLLAWYVKLGQKIMRSEDTFLIATIIFFTIVCFIERIIAGNIGFGMFYLILLSTAVFNKCPIPKRKLA